MCKFDLFYFLVLGIFLLISISSVNRNYSTMVDGT
jgi:hypothetical protein